MNDFYEQKAQKYKYKYLKLKELEGGDYGKFRDEMNACLSRKLPIGSQSFYYPTLNPQKNGYEYKDSKGEYNFSHVRTALEDGRVHRPSGEYKVVVDTNYKPTNYRLITQHPHQEQPVQQQPAHQAQPIHQAQSASLIPEPPLLYDSQRIQQQYRLGPRDMVQSIQPPSMQPQIPAQMIMQPVQPPMHSMHSMHLMQQAPMPMQVPEPAPSMYSMQQAPMPMQVPELAPSMYSIQQAQMQPVVRWDKDVHNPHSINGHDGRRFMSPMQVQRFQQGGSALSSTSSEDFLAE